MRFSSLISFNAVQNNTSLKQGALVFTCEIGFNAVQNNTSLKLRYIYSERK